MEARDPLEERAAREIERHGEALRRLARRLVHDPATADDLVQEAWAAALAAGRTLHGGSPAQGAAAARGPVEAGRGWLAGVVANLGRSRRRDEARRDARERRAARAESSTDSDPANALARLETMRRVLDAVEALPEPYRGTVLLRFFEDLPPREVARRQGVPVNTVRTRTRRGLSKLRAALDPGDEEGRRALLGALLPFAGAPRLLPWAPGLPTIPAALEAGALAMSAKLPVLAAVALCAALAFLGLRALEAPPARDGVPPALARGAPAAPEERIPSAEAGTAAVTPEAEQAREPAPRSALGPAPPREPIAWGRAELGRAGKPLPGARVLLELFEGYEVADEPLERVELVADGEAVFRWEGARPAGAHVVRVDGATPGHEAFPWSVPVLPGDEPPELTLRLFPLDAWIEGEVRDEEGAPIPGASVDRHGRERITTDEHGRFRLASSSHYEKVHVHAWAPGFGERGAAARIEGPGQPSRLAIVLPRAVRLAGRVVDGAGLAVEGASVTGGADATAVRTDAEGRFELAHLDPAHSPHSVRVEAPGFMRSITTAASTEAELEIVLSRGVAVSGVVVDGQGQPLEGVRVGVGLSPRGYGGAEGFSRADGSFELQAVIPGRTWIRGTRKGFVIEPVELDVPESSDRLAGVVLELAGVAGARELEGTVLGPGGEPLAGAWVSAGIEDRHRMLEHVGGVRSDEHGRFHLTGLPARKLVLQATASGFVPGKLSVAAEQTGGAELRLRPSGGLAGRVVDAATGEPVPRFGVRFARSPALAPGERPLSGGDSSWWFSGVTFAGAEGRWDTGGIELEPGTVGAVEITAEGYAPVLVARAVVAEDPGAAPLEVALEPGVTLAGRVIEAGSARPLAGARVSLADGISELREHDLHALPSTATDAAGSFELAHVAPGMVRLVVRADGHPLVVDGPFELPAEGLVRGRTVAVPAGARLFGRLLDGDGLPLAGERLQVNELEQRGLGVRGARTALTDAQGRFELDALPPGRLTLAAFRSGESATVALRRVTLELEDGEAREVELGPTGGASLIGQLVDAYGEGTVTLVPGDWDGRGTPETAWGALARDGRFEIRGLAAGRYTLSARSNHGRNMSGVALRAIDLAPDQPHAVELELGMGTGR